MGGVVSPVIPKRCRQILSCLVLAYFHKDCSSRIDDTYDNHQQHSRRTLEYFRNIYLSAFSQPREGRKERIPFRSITTLPPLNHNDSFARFRRGETPKLAAETCKMHNQMQMEAGEGGHIGGNEAGVPKTVGGFSNESAVHRHRGMYHGGSVRSERDGRNGGRRRRRRG